MVTVGADMVDPAKPNLENTPPNPNESLAPRHHLLRRAESVSLQWQDEKAKGVGFLFGFWITVFHGTNKKALAKCCSTLFKMRMFFLRWSIDFKQLKTYYMVLCFSNENCVLDPCTNTSSSKKNI